MVGESVQSAGIEDIMRSSVLSKSFSSFKKPLPLLPPSSHDLIGPPDRLTNLRPYRFHVPDTETALHAKWRALREDTHAWSTGFWARHNREFAKVRRAFSEPNLKIN